jgi:major membrane immunogen (membrane-anchored lipoprotein)
MMTITTRSSQLTVTAVLLALLAAGCGQSDTKQAGNPPAAASRTTAAPAPKISGSGEFNNAAALLLDGITPADQTAFDSEQCVHWVDPAVGFVIDLGEVRRVTGVTLQVDNNDDYTLETSRDGAVYAAYATIPAAAGANEWGLETHSTLPGHASAVPGLAVTPAEARYLRLRGSEGDGAYGVSEVRVASESLAASAAAPAAAAQTQAAPASTADATPPAGRIDPDGGDMSMEQVFDTVDANRDGKLTRAEYAAIWKEGTDVDAKFAYFDRDRSGFIERQEFLTLPGKLRDGEAP